MINVNKYSLFQRKALERDNYSLFFTLVQNPEIILSKIITLLGSPGYFPGPLIIQISDVYSQHQVTQELDVTVFSPKTSGHAPSSTRH